MIFIGVSNVRNDLRGELGRSVNQFETRRRERDSLNGPGDAEEDDLLRTPSINFDFIQRMDGEFIHSLLSRLIVLEGTADDLRLDLIF